MKRFLVPALCLLSLAALLPACGPGQTITVGFATMVVTQIEQVNPPNWINCVGVTPAPVIITGGDYSGIVGQRVYVRWSAKDPLTPGLPGPHILHNGEQDYTFTSGTVVSPTTIETVSPQLDIPCNLMLTANVDGCVEVYLSSGAKTQEAFFPGLFKIPGVGGWTIMTAFGTTAPACEPIPFTLTSTNLEPVGGSVSLHWVDTSAGGSFQGNDETHTLATITSTTTIEGLTPNVVLCGLNGLMDIVVDLDRIEWVNEPVCLELVPPLTLTFEGPDLTTLAFDPLNAGAATYTGAYAVGEVPSTYLENPDPTQLNKFDTMEGFVITGAGFGPVGDNALVTFTDLGGATAFDDSGGPAVTVVGTILDATTITGRLPGVNDPANRLLADVRTQVNVEFATGCCVTQDAFASFIAPPTPQAVTNLDAGTGNGFFAAALPTDYYGCHSQNIQIDGVNFDVPVRGQRIFDTNLGIIAGRHGTGTPAPLAFDRDLDVVTINSAVLNSGYTRVEPRIADWDTDGDGLVPTTIRLTNADGQCGEIGVDYQPVGRQDNRSNDGAAINSNVSVAIDPTSCTGGANSPPVPDDFCFPTNDAVNGSNIAVAMENDLTDQSVSNSFSGTELFLDRSLDGGLTWSRTVIDDAIDVFPAAAIRSFPMVHYDRFGNLHLTYLVDDFAGGVSHVQVLTSPDQGASFPFGGSAYATGAGGVGLIDRPLSSVGPGTGTNEAVLVGFVDASLAIVPDAVIAITVQFSTFSTLGVLFPPAQVDTLPPGAGVFFRTHAATGVGPSGEHYVSWVEPDFSVFPPVSRILINVDADGVAGGSTYGTESVVASGIEFPLGPPPSQPDAGRLIPLQDMVVIQGGTHAGRVVVAYEDVSPSSILVNPTFLSVFSTYSDDLGQTWNAESVHQSDTSDQFLPALGADPLTNEVYVTWYDTKNSAPVNNLTQRFAASSEAGSGWGAPLLISDGQSSQTAGDNEAIEYGVWAGVAAWGGCVVAGWADTADNAGLSDAAVRLFQMVVGN